MAPRFENPPRRLGRRSAVTALVAVLVVALWSTSVGAASSATATATATATASATATATTVAGQNADPTAAGPGPSSTADPDPATDDPAADDPAVERLPADPMVNEEPGEEPPATEETVPPQEIHNGQTPFEPAEILWSSVAAAERKLADSKRLKQDQISEVRNLRKRSKELGRDRQALDRRTRDALDDLDDATDRLASRAVFGFQQFGSGSDDQAQPDPSNFRQVLDAQRRSKMVTSVLDVDRSDLDRLAEMRAELTGSVTSLLDRSQLVADYLADVEAGIADLDEAIDQAAIEYEAFRAGSEVFIHGVAFPIGGSYPTPLIDSYGFPRMTGTPDEHWHEGIDIFAPRGTPLVATERGIITKLGVGRLGGLKFWLKGESGSEWYYAHLDSFAPGLANGVVVEAGDLVGYVGNTGNAVGTPPHLHMQLHPGGGRPVNPYPLLKVVSDLELAAIANGTSPGPSHQPVVVDRPAPEPPPQPTTTVPLSPSEATSTTLPRPQAVPDTGAAAGAVPVDPSAGTDG